MPAATSVTSGGSNSGGPATPVSPASSAASASSGSAASSQQPSLHAHAHLPHMPHAVAGHAHGHDEDDEDDADDDGGAATGAAGDKKRGHGASCHQCKTTKDPQYLFFCTNKAEKGVRKRRCRKKYCDSCLKRSYGNDLSDIIPSWQCPSCLGLCICAACHRKSTKRGAAPVAPSGSPSSIVSGHEEVPSGGEIESQHQPASSPTSSKRTVKSEKIKTESGAASAGTPRQRKRAVAAHVQMAPEEDEQQQQQQQQGSEYDHHQQHDSYNDPHSQSHGHHAPPPQLYMNGIHSSSSAQQIAAHNQLAFSLASPNPLSSSHSGHMLLTPNAALAHAMLTPNGTTNYNLNTYPNLDNGNQLDLESMTSAGSYRTGSASVGGSGSAMQTPMPGGALNSLMQFSPNPAMYGTQQQQPLMQYATATSVDAQLQHVQQQIQIQQAILAQHQQAQTGGGGYAAGLASPSFTVPQPARGTSFVVDDDEQSTVGGGGATTAGTEFTGDGDNESEYSSSYQSHRNPTMHANGLTVEQMQALRLQQQQQQMQSISPEVTASQSNLMRQAGLDQRRAMEEGVHGNHAGSMSVPSKTRSISGRSNAAADRLSISPLTISRGMSGEDRPAGVGAGVERLSLGGADSNRGSPRFSSRSLSGRGNSSTTPSTVAAGADPVVSGEDSSVGLSASQLAELEPLMAGMNAAQRQSFLAEAKSLNSSSTNVTTNGTISSNVPSPHSGSPRSAKRKIAAAAAATNPNSGATQAPAVDLSCPNQHVKYQMVARLKSQMSEGHSAGSGGTGTGTGTATANSTGSSPVLNNPADDEVIARTKLLQNEQKQMRLQHAMDEERRRLAALSGHNKRSSPSQAHRDLNISVKSEHSPQQQQQHPSASPPNGLPPSHNTPTSGTRRAQLNNKQLPSPLTHLTASSSPPPPAVPQQHQQQFNNQGPLLFSPVPVFQSHNGGNGGSGGLAAGAQSPSTMLNLVDSSASSSAGSSGGSSGMFSPPAPMFASSQLSMLPGQNSYAQHGQQPDYLQWGGSAPAAGSHNASALNMLSPLPGQLHMSFPGSSTPGLSSHGHSHAGNPASLALFSPNPMMLGSSSHHYPSHANTGAQGGNAGLGLFSPDAYSSSAGSNLHYPAPLVPVLPASHDSGLGGDSLSYRQLSAGGQNLQMGGLDDSSDFMRQSSANLGMTPAPSTSS